MCKNGIETEFLKRIIPQRGPYLFYKKRDPREGSRADAYCKKRLRKIL